MIGCSTFLAISFFTSGCNNFFAGYFFVAAGLLNLFEGFTGAPDLLTAVDLLIGASFGLI
jgi:hypothetical protein